MSLKSYKSHKTVEAAKIIALTAPTTVVVINSSNGSETVTVDPSYFEKHKPEVGGYYVKYGDGYESWSPAAAFETGYTAIGPEGSFTPPPIKGYRTLSKVEVDLMNEIKTKGLEIEILVDHVRDYVKDQAEAAAGNREEQLRLANAEPGRWASIGRTDLQQGFMALTRAVAQPNSF